AVAAGGGRGRTALLYPDRRRIRHSRPARRLGYADDRADAVDGIFLQQGLADGLGAGGHAVVPVDRAVDVLRALATAPVGGVRLMRHGPSPFNVAAVALGLAFLYLPIAILVIYSFNAS